MISKSLFEIYSESFLDDSNTFVLKGQVCFHPNITSITCLNHVVSPLRVWNNILWWLETLWDLVGFKDNWLFQHIWKKANLVLMQLIKQHLRRCMHCAVAHISNPHTTISPVAVGWRVGQNCAQCCSHPSDPWANWNVCQLITITHQLLWLRAMMCKCCLIYYINSISGNIICLSTE